MQHCAKQLSQKMAQLLQELEQKNTEQRSKEQNRVVWRALLFAALRHWQYWVLWFIAATTNNNNDKGNNKGREASSTGPVLPGAADSTMAEPLKTVTAAEKKNDLAAPGNGVGDGDRSVLRWGYRGTIATKSLGWKEAQIKWMGQEKNRLNHFFFDCWSPQEDEPVYRLLVPLKPPPRGHTFCLEPGSVANESRIRVELECTCTAQQTVGRMRCFLHKPKEQLRKKQKPSLLHTLCTSSCLDAQKTARWFQDLLRENKAILGQLRSRYYILTVLPSRRSCKVAIEHISGRTTLVEMIFVVQVGNSDIFMSSQAREGVFSPSTTWTLTCAWAEAKFLRLMLDQSPDDTLLSCLHLYTRMLAGTGFSRYAFKTACPSMGKALSLGLDKKSTCRVGGRERCKSWSSHANLLSCLHLCTRMLAGTGFSRYALKTVVMHLLTTTPLSGWRSTHFLQRLSDITRYLCLEKNRLNHFFFDCWSPQEDEPVYRLLMRIMKRILTEMAVKQWNKVPKGNGDVPKPVGIPLANGQCS
ncbi:LOW QUALITY PROTEIN: inositol 1,4,5-trisphosphate receptor-interacting protein-like 1 [Pezoporus wallicus]|uniref:LOW QUALITY PROTEIN: inositol 1,4,5-trisphosphate receptor-interacting protein-like 1 n=1 Tax=Pezoporus wallicus TaxID=35540 RepID=UPI002550E335|nr:LOW QUALITY PROTEIN: inositol 1,4,5-trisphosphate receptor-interacting protein-like 1 [Pezoporus wallicus]